MEPAIYLAVLGPALLATSALLRAAPRVRASVLGMEAGRLASLDGLRGILALTVLIHHAMLGFVLGSATATQANLAAHPFTAQIGPVSVGLFFLISAYLFGGRLLRTGGRLDTGRFLAGRASRLVPLYVAVIGAVLFVSLARQGFALTEPADKIGREAVRYLSFGFLPRYALNGWKEAADVTGMIWSLKYEWLLYLLLPLLAYLFRRSGHVAALYGPLLLLGIVWSGYFFLFAAGILAAQLTAFDGRAAVRAWAGAALIGLAILLASFQGVGGWWQALLLTPLLVVAVQARGPLRLLSSPTLRYLGEISYSIYLTHGLVLWAASAIGADAHGSAARFILLGVGEVMAAIALSTMTFLIFEKPFLRRPVPYPVAWRRAGAGRLQQA